MRSITLTDGSRVGVVGAGPAGTFFSHFLLRLAKQRGLNLQLKIYDRKTFSEYGPRGCNMCAGTIGANLVERLFQEHISLPPQVVRHEIDGYALHVGPHRVHLHYPSGPIYTVFRGRTPTPSSDQLSFDQHLLDHVVQQGVVHVRENVEGVVIPQGGSDRAVVKLSDEGGEEELDLVVGAFGVNGPMGKRLVFGYRPPETWSACQAELSVSEDYLHRRLGDMIHIFNLGDKDVDYVAFTPKKEFLTVTAIGRNVSRMDLQRVLKLPIFKDYLPEPLEINCHCHPRMPVTAAHRPYADRVVIVGDACISRYLKNGIESAYYTAMFAAQTAVDMGVSEKAFRHGYFRRCKRMFGIDNACGKVLFVLNRRISSSELLPRAHLRVAHREQLKRRPGKRRLNNVLWHMFSGDAPYTHILAMALNPSLQVELTFETLRAALGRQEGRQEDIGRTSIVEAVERAPDPRLRDGDTVAIVGGGPGGTSCAIELLRGARRKGLKLRVVIFEGKDFEQHYNQCVGVLSPPVEEILRTELHIDLPDHLIRRQIEMYTLHCGDEQVSLAGGLSTDGTYTVRRVMFDSFMLERAKEAGAEVIRDRVTGIEILKKGQLDEVRVYSEGGYLRAAALVGAFGLDHAMIDHMELVTRDNVRYRRPASLMTTFIFKVQADPDFIANTLGDTIHAFLLAAVPKVEFGAVTPKEDHIVVSIAGRGVSSLDMDAFLQQSSVRALLPDLGDRDIEYFRGAFPTAPAHNPYGHRFVIVGDATGWLRPFKGKGINTAIITGIRAAQVMLRVGVFREAFHEYAAWCQDLRDDYYYGTAVRRLCNFFVNRGLFDSIVRLAATDPKLREALYLSVSGEDSYKNITRILLKPALFKDLSLAVGGRMYRIIAANVGASAARG